MATVPDPAPIRLNLLVDRPIDPRGDYVLYWMTAERRTFWSFALQRAVGLAQRLDKPLLVLEAVDADYPWASTRFHTFLIQGMVDNQKRFAEAGVGYLPYVEPEPGAGRGLLRRLSARACVVLGDERPAYRYPSLQARAARRVEARFELVDGGTFSPLRLPSKEHGRAVDFRRHLHKVAAAGLLDRPVPDPLAEKLPAFDHLPSDITARWPAADLRSLLTPGGLGHLPIDASIGPVSGKPGGSTEAGRRFQAFLGRISKYTERNHPDVHAPTGLSPWLHFGHISASEMGWTVLDREGWTPERMNRAAFSKQQGAWGLSPGAEAFLEELLTWRELAFHTAFLQPEGHARYEGLPGWCRATLAAHAADARESLYSLDTLAAGRTADPLWNAAQRELRETGVIHNYLRMLWGKRVLAWTPDPQTAFLTLIELNNRYALDGRDPNSYAGIAWCFGRYDRPWGPERPVYGTIRFMSSASTRKKLEMDAWAKRFGA
jgi:deoxyribodipyrimidine photo-lyase